MVYGNKSQKESKKYVTTETIALVRAKINWIPSVSPGQWSPYHLCGKWECFLSAQSNAAASSWLETSAVSWASQPSAASPWTWRSAASPSRGLPLQVSHSWIELRNTTRKHLCQEQQSPSCCVTAGAVRHYQNMSAILNCCRALPLFYISVPRPIKVEGPAQRSLFLFGPHAVSGWQETAGLNWPVSCWRWMNAAVIVLYK